jgi:hypothetical protein
MVGKINQGADFNFFRKVTVNTPNFPNEANIIFDIKYQVSFSLVNEGNDIVEYSFNGNVLHGDLTPGTSTGAIFFDNRRVSFIWFRARTPGQIVRVEAWSQM